MARVERLQEILQIRAVLLADGSEGHLHRAPLLDGWSGVQYPPKLLVGFPVKKRLTLGVKID